MSDQLDQWKREMLERQRVWALANPEEAAAQSEKMAQGLRDIPVRQMLDQLQYIDTQLLPAVRKRGRKEEIDFFESLMRSLSMSVILADRYEYLYGKYLNSRIEVVLLRDHLKMTEKELERYCTVEDLLMSDAINRYAEVIAKRVKQDILRVKK